ncbi:bifunctional tetrahydrofolate synthase/dihydrofolate synthase [Thiomicrorhabdus sediminis]|uniref:Dihydrofolate synthase/folylpolyglutamate synthase n=1 Tax=Thiomicrorhabdus sediminis TaxID=2580412 RepID=A0A4P9K4T3_9GAMM|nr:bifunctional tetrahydrofolate synthase/dihydrofolate synthase [Thiomicrorhabdus sediminis]QCU89751.1 bifunctional tetrahydrofolate synthase/dihydrofolate synthase [Thiomicrorhabdus sediminis]
MNTPTSQSSLETWVDWLLNLHNQEIDLGLERIAKVAEKLSVQKPTPFVITVAGTNGKGSSVAMLSSIYAQAGLTVGTYTSPHIHCFSERIKINGHPVSKQQIVDAFVTIEQARGEIKLTYFEFSTLAALVIFQQAGLDLIVLEVGLGGRLDAVNVVDADMALVTAIDIDHIDWLGDDRAQIAIEKAGIMRAERMAVCSDPTVPATLIEYADKLDAKLTLLARDYNYQALSKDSWSMTSSVSPQARSYCRPALSGDFQLQNAAGVLEVVARLQDRFKVSDEQINQGLQQVSHAGRMEWRDLDGQAWLIDVAHNPQSAQVLARSLQQIDAENTSIQQSVPRVAVFSALDDKDMLPMVEAVAPFVDYWLLADLQIPRASSIVKLEQILINAGVASEQVQACSTIDQAVKLAAQKKDNQVLVWGSFFTVAQALQTWQNLGRETASISPVY